MTKREIGKVEQVSIRRLDTTPGLCITFDYDGSGQVLACYLNPRIIAGVMNIFDVQELSDIVGKYCWVTHTEGGIQRLEPLHPRTAEPLDIGATGEDED